MEKSLSSKAFKMPRADHFQQFTPNNGQNSSPINSENDVTLDIYYEAIDKKVVKNIFLKLFRVEFFENI